MQQSDFVCFDFRKLFYDVVGDKVAPSCLCGKVNGFLEPGHFQCRFRAFEGRRGGGRAEAW